MKLAGIAVDSARVFPVAEDGEMVSDPLKLRRLPLSVDKRNPAGWQTRFLPGGGFLFEELRAGNPVWTENRHEIAFCPDQIHLDKSIFSGKDPVFEAQTESGIQLPFEYGNAFPCVPVPENVDCLKRFLMKRVVLSGQKLEIPQDFFRLAVSESDIAEFTVRIRGGEGDRRDLPGGEIDTSAHIAIAQK